MQVFQKELLIDIYSLIVIELLSGLENHKRDKLLNFDKIKPKPVMNLYIEVTNYRHELLPYEYFKSQIKMRYLEALANTLYLSAGAEIKYRFY